MGKDKKKSFSENSNSSQGFIGFGGGSSNSTGFGLSQVLSEASNAIQNVDPEYQMAFKSLQKKDSVTKLKALQELNVLFKGLTDTSVSSVLKLWTSSYSKLSLDSDRRVRESTNQTFNILVRSVKKNLAPFLKQLLPLWLLNCFDPCKEVTLAAKTALQSAIPENKQADAFVFCKEEIFELFTENIQSSVQTLSDTKIVPPEVAIEKYERVVSSTIFALSHILESLSPTQLPSLQPHFLSILDSKFWSLFTSKHTIIRRSIYRMITSLSSKLPETIETNIGQLSPLILGSFSERDNTLHQEMWEAVLTFMRLFPSGWQHVNAKKQIFPKLWAFLRGGSFGSSKTSYLSLLPFLNFLPSQILQDVGFDFLVNLWEGLQSDSMNGPSSLCLLEAFEECFLHIVSQFKKLNQEQEVIKTMETCYFNAVKTLLEQPKFPLPFEDANRILIQTFASLSLNSQENSAFWKKFNEFAKAKLNEEVKGESSSEFHTKLERFLFVLHLKNLELNKENSIQFSDFATDMFNIYFPLARDEKKSYLLPLVSTLAYIFPSKIFDKAKVNEDSLLDWFKDWSQLNIESVNSLLDFFSTTPNHKQFGEKLLEIIFTLPNYHSLLKSCFHHFFSKNNVSQQSKSLEDYSLKIIGDLLKETDENTISLLFDNLSSILSRGFVSDEVCLQILRDLNSQIESFNDNFLLSFHLRDFLSQVLPTKLQDQNSERWELITANLAAELFDSRVSMKYLKSGFENEENELDVNEAKLRRSINQLSDPKLILSTLTLAPHSRLMWENSMEKTSSLPQTWINRFFTLSVDKISKRLNDLQVNWDKDLECSVLLGEQAQHLLNFTGKSVEDMFDSFGRNENWVELRSDLFHEISKQLPEFAFFEPLKGEKRNVEKELRYSKWIVFFVSFFRTTEDISFLKEEKGEFILLELTNSLAFFHSKNSPLLKELSTKFVNNFFNDLIWKELADDNISNSIQKQLVHQLFQQAFTFGGLYSKCLVEFLYRIYSKSDSRWNDIYDEELKGKLAEVPKKNNYLLVFWIVYPNLPQSIARNLRKETFEWISRLEEKDLVEKNEECSNMFFLAGSMKYEELAPEENEILDNLLSKSFKRIQNNISHAEFQIAFTQLILLSLSLRPNGEKSLRSKELDQSLMETIPVWMKMKFSSHPKMEWLLRYNTLNVILELAKRSEGTMDVSLQSLVLQALPNLCKDNQSNEMIETISNILSFCKGDLISEDLSIQLFSLLIEDSVEIQNMIYPLLLQFVQTFGEKELNGGSEKESNEESLEENVLPVGLRTIIENKNVFSEEVKTFGYILSWSLVFYLIDEAPKEKRNLVSNYLRKRSLVSHLLNIVVKLLDLDKGIPKEVQLDQISEMEILEGRSLQLLSSKSFYSAAKTFPVLVRLWWNDDFDRRAASAVDKFTKKHISPSLQKNEIGILSSFKHSFDDFSLKTSSTTNQVTANYEKDEVCLTISIRIPEDYPLKIVEMDIPQRSGVSEGQYRKWLLSMTTLLMTQDGSILDAILLWKSNLDKHFDGVEVCPICYSLFDPSNRLPGLACKTCRNKFHSSCMYKWIKVSHKNDCPLCKTPFN
eukprot:TRINITY_DN2981_c0_g1_i1.p1 TRINITY_DN2981_c0_g1~~TRINITY_DN2981_c0_g1_i1.p1  ORF type:complete len:1580 (+),score=519.39 TRINITY_DN2981_c0_g1_i1:179-4918(+)